MTVGESTAVASYAGTSGAYTFTLTNANSSYKTKQLTITQEPITSFVHFYNGSTETTSEYITGDISNSPYKVLEYNDSFGDDGFSATLDILVNEGTFSDAVSE